MYIYTKKCKILLTFTGLTVCVLLNLLPRSWKSNQSGSQPSRRTNGDDNDNSRTDSFRHEMEQRGSQNRNTSVLQAGKEMIKNFSSDGLSFDLERPVNGGRQQSQGRVMTSTGDHPRQLQLPKEEYVTSQTSRVSLSQRPMKENETNLSLVLQASHLRFERKMALYSQQEIGQPVMYTRENIPSDLRALAPQLFSRFPREFLPEYKSPCWKVNNKTLKCLPYFFIGGFPKCATTDLRGKLLTHPALVTTHKEPLWWTKTNFEGTTIEKYIHHYSILVRAMEYQHRKDLITCDATAVTFQDNAAVIARLPPNLREDMKYVTADFIRAALPGLKFIGIMRNPTERAYSAYMYFSENGALEKSPENFHIQAVKAIKEYYECTDNNHLRFCAYSNIVPRLNTGCYSFYIREYMKRFPRDQFYFLRTEDWSDDPAHYMKEIYTFLEIDPLSEKYRLNVTMTGNLNRRKSDDRRLGLMLPQTKKLLDDFYRPCNQDLAKLLNDDKYLWLTDTDT